MRLTYQQGEGQVALRKESVDRNTNPGSTTLTFPGSLSARRAWIEMIDSLAPRLVDMSLSARRAWIEIAGTTGKSNRAISRSPQGERG